MLAKTCKISLSLSLYAALSLELAGVRLGCAVLCCAMPCLALLCYAMLQCFTVPCCAALRYDLHCAALLLCTACCTVLRSPMLCAAITMGTEVGQNMADQGWAVQGFARQGASCMPSILPQ